MDYSKFRDYGDYLEYCAEEAADKAEKEHGKQSQELKGERLNNKYQLNLKRYNNDTRRNRKAA